MNETDKFSITKRAKSFTHAGRGIGIFFTMTHNAWIHAVIFIITISFGFYFQITKTEWFVILIASGIVFVAEAFNTAIEIDMDLTSPEYHPAARDTKDVAAGAVLISAIIAVILGVMIFAPYILG